jgi:hypothetical protein
MRHDSLPNPIRCAHDLAPSRRIRKRYRAHMSIQAICWVLEHSEAEGVSRLVLLAIANHASAVGTDSYPSIDQIAREARCSSRTVIRTLDTLVRLGELGYVRNGAPFGGKITANRRPNLYWLPGMPGCPGHELDAEYNDVVIHRGDNVSPLNRSRGGGVSPLDVGSGVTSAQFRGDTAVTQNVLKTVHRDSLPSAGSEPATSLPVDNHEEDGATYQAFLVDLAMSHVGGLLAEEVRAVHRERYAAEVVRRGSQRPVVERLAALYPTAHPEWIARTALELPCAPPPPRACSHCGAPTGHRGGTCPTLVADPVIADELRAAEFVSA